MKKLTLLLISFSFFAQTKGVVIDEFGKPIPYVNIWVENENIGTTSEENGGFSITVAENKTLVFSAIGFETLIAKLNESGKIVLKSIAYQLDEVVIQKRIGKDKIEIGNYKEEDVTMFLGSGLQPSILAKFITPTDDINKHPFIDNISFPTFSNINKARIKVRFYEVAEDRSPGLDYLEDIFIVTVKRGKRNTSLDLKDKNIKIPDTGLFIAFEWMIINENKYTFKYTLDEENAKVEGWFPGSKKKVYKDGLSYCPSIGIIPSVSSPTWSFIGGKWVVSKEMYKNTFHSKLPDKYESKFGESAIKIILTN